MNTEKNFSHKFFSGCLHKIIIFFSYLAILAAFLYMPLLFDFFQTSKTLNVLVFAETICPEAVALFEEKSGINVNMTYVEMDDHTFAKFEMNEGEGYDVVNMSDFMVYYLGQRGLLHKLDHAKMTCIPSLYQRLLHQDYDPENSYSLPHKWYTYGLVYDKAFFNKKPSEMTLDYILIDPEILAQKGIVQSPYRVCMLDDARDATFLVMLYLHGRVTGLSRSELADIGQLLVKQKRWVEAYTVHSAQYFLFADIVPVALMSSNYMRKILDYSNRFEFAIPKEGSMLIVENLVIPKRSKKQELAQQFIDFMLSDEIALMNSTAYGFNSGNQKADTPAKEQYSSCQHLFPDDQVFKRLVIPLLSSDMRRHVEDEWLKVGFA